MISNNFNTNKTKENIRKKFYLPLNKKIIEYVGKYKTMGKEKGVSEIIFQFAELLKTEKEIFLLLVGPNPNETNEIEEFFESLKIGKADYAVVTHVRQKEMPSYLKCADVLLMNYPDSEHYGKYMSPVKMFEYMASGAPIVSTDLPSIREVLGESNAVLVPEGQLQSGVVKVLRDSELAATAGRQAALDVKKYEWQNRVRKILQSDPYFF